MMRYTSAARGWPTFLPLGLVLALIVLLVACVSAPPSSSRQPVPGTTTNSGRYQMEHDSGVLEPIDLAQIQPVVPKVEPRTLAGNKSPYTINGRTYQVMSSETGYSEEGMASWYGRKFHGHLTSNGEIYDMFQVSAAHTRLPIPSYIRVTNLDNGKSIVARVNDRGPFHEGRVVDLSYAGAVLLDYADKGTARVRVEALSPEGAAAQPVAAATLSQIDSVAEQVASERRLIAEERGAEYLQVGAFANLDSAQTLVSRLSGLTSLPVFIQSDAGSNGATLHKVRVGPLSNEVSIQELIDNVQAQQLGTPFRVRI